VARGHRQEVLHHPAAPERTPVLQEGLATDRPDRVEARACPGAALLRGQAVEEVAMMEVGSWVACRVFRAGWGRGRGVRWQMLL